MSLFCKRQSYLPSVVLPRPAWQEKAHCVAAGSFFLFSYLSFLMFIIYTQVPFVIFITFYIYLLFLCRLLVSTFLFWQAWLPFHLLIISCFPSFIYFCFSWHIFLLSKKLTCFKESTRMSKQTSVGQVSSTTGTLTHWGWTILSYEDLF